MNLDSKHIPLETAFLCPCGLVGDNAVQCACGNALGLLSLVKALNRETATQGPLFRWCTKCGRPIEDQKRIRRKSPYCSDDCRREARREMRALLAQGRCRLCGRAQRRPSQAAIESACVAPGAHAILPFDLNQPHNLKG